jgi:hypothetical protein
VNTCVLYWLIDATRNDPINSCSLDGARLAGRNESHQRSNLISTRAFSRSLADQTRDLEPFPSALSVKDGINTYIGKSTMFLFERRRFVKKGRLGAIPLVL